MTNTVCC